MTSTQTTTTKKASKPVPLKVSKGVDKYGFSKTGKRAFAATLYAKGATTAQVKAKTLVKYGKGYPMLNMLKKLDTNSKAWKVTTTNKTSGTTGRAVTVYRIVARK